MIPSLRGAGSTITRELSGIGSSAGTKSGNLFAGTFKKALVPLAGIAAAAIGGGAIVGFLSDSVNAASDLQQSLGGVDAIFGKSAKSIHKWAKTAQDSVGLSENAYNSLASVIGSQLKNSGTAMDQVGVKTNNLIKQGADLAATFGGTTADAVSAISSALKGERDPIERYGVSLNQAAVDAEAASLGFKKVGGTLSTAGSQAATMSLILKQTSAATGQFGKQSNTLAEQQQILAAKFENVKAKIGTAFLPAITSIVTALGKFLTPALTAITPFLNDFATGLTNAVAKGGPLEGLAKGISTAFGAITGSTQSVDLDPAAENAKAALLKVKGVASTTATDVKTAFSTVDPALRDAFKEIGPILTQGFKDLSAALTGAMPQFRELGVSLLPGIVSGAQILAIVLPPLATALGVVAGALGKVNTVLNGPGGGTNGLFGDIITSTDKTKVALDGLNGKYGAVVQIIGQVTKTVLGGAKNSWANLTGYIGSSVGRLRGFISDAVANFNRMRDGVNAAILRAVATIAAFPRRAAAALGNTGSLLVNSGRALIQGFINGIGQMVNAVGNKVGEVMKRAREFFPHSPAKRGPFSGAGWRQVATSGDALATQFTSGFNGGIRDFASTVGGIVPDTISSSVSGTITNASKASRTSVLIANKTNVRLEDLVDVRIARNSAEESRAFRMGYQPVAI